METRSCTTTPSTPRRTAVYNTRLATTQRLPGDANVPSNHGDNAAASNGSTPRKSPEFVLLAVDVVKGPTGFGFTLGETKHGQIIRQIADPARCRHMSVGDIVLAVNGVRVVGWSHDDTVDMLRRCPYNCVTRLTLVTSRVTSRPSGGQNGYVTNGHVTPAANHADDAGSNLQNGRRHSRGSQQDVVQDWTEAQKVEQQQVQEQRQRRTSAVTNPPHLSASSPLRRLPSSPPPGSELPRSLDVNHVDGGGGGNVGAGQSTEQLRRSYLSVNSTSRSGTPYQSTTSGSAVEESPQLQQRKQLQQQQPHRPASRGVRGKLAALVSRRSTGTPSAPLRSLPQTPSVESVDSMTSYYGGSGLLTRTPSITSLNFSGTPDFIPASMYGGQMDSLRQTSRTGGGRLSNGNCRDSSTSGVYHVRSSLTPAPRCAADGDDSFQSTASLSSGCSSNFLNNNGLHGSDNASGSGFDDVMSRRPVDSDPSTNHRPAFTGREACNGYNTRTEVIYSAAAAPAHSRRRSNTENSSRCSSVLGDQTTSGFVNTEVEMPSSNGIVQPRLNGFESASHNHQLPSFTSWAGFDKDEELMDGKNCGPEVAVNGASRGGGSTVDKENQRNAALSYPDMMMQSTSPAASRRPPSECPTAADDVTSPSAEEYYDVELHRGSRGFGFSIRGGKEFDGMPLYVLNIADGGAADMDGRLQNEDHIMAINGSSTLNMTHTAAVELIQNSPSPLQLLMKRINSQRHQQQLKHGVEQRKTAAAATTTTTTRTTPALIGGSSPGVTLRHQTAAAAAAPSSNQHPHRLARQRLVDEQLLGITNNNNISRLAAPRHR